MDLIIAGRFEPTQSSDWLLVRRMSPETKTSPRIGTRMKAWIVCQSAETY
jgi:hypothetical protein